MDSRALDLAMLALSDEAGIPVLADYLLETGFDEAYVWSLIERKQPYNYDEDEDDLDEWRHRALSKPTAKLPRAVAAVGLFGQWPQRWPLAKANARRAYDEMMFGAPQWDASEHHVRTHALLEPRPAFWARISTDDIDPKPDDRRSDTPKAEES